MNTANNFSAADTAVRRIPLEDFFRNSQKAAFQLSPDGRHLSFMAPYEERMNVFVRPVEGGEAVRVTSETLRSVAGYMWADNERLLYMKDTGGRRKLSALRREHRRLRPTGIHGLSGG